MDTKSQSKQPELNLPQQVGTKELVAGLFKDDDGHPITLSPSQVDIFEAIYFKRNPRVQVMTYSQFGKSMTVALAVLMRVTTFAEKWIIVAPQEDKAKIIMDYIIKHAFDNPYTKSKMELDKNESLDRLRRERSKKKLTFKIGGGKVSEVMVLSADERNKRDAGNTLMGFGAPNVIEDEAALLSDDVNAKIVRLLGGYSTTGNFLMKIGNPFRRNHFLRTHTDETYHHIIVDHEQGIREGRMTREFVTEMSKENLFSILYACEFPADDDVDREGWSRLVTDAEVDNAIVDSAPMAGDLRLGVDVADGGADSSVICRRSMNFADIIFDTKRVQSMQLASHVVEKMEDDSIESRNVSVDKTGVGTATVQKLHELGRKIYAFTAGETALRPKSYYNKRAEAYWGLRQWIKEGGMLKKHHGWQELKSIKYRFDEQGRIQIMSKERMRQDGVRSPNYADALMLTFARPIPKNIAEMEEKNFATILRKRRKSSQHHSLKAVNY